MTLTENDSSHLFAYMMETEGIKRDYMYREHHAKIRSMGMMKCKGILLDEATDDWSGCSGGNDCPTCYGSGYMPIPADGEADHE